MTLNSMELIKREVNIFTVPYYLISLYFAYANDCFLMLRSFWRRRHPSTKLLFDCLRYSQRQMVLTRISNHLIVNWKILFFFFVSLNFSNDVNTMIFFLADCYLYANRKLMTIQANHTICYRKTYRVEDHHVAGVH